MVSTQIAEKLNNLGHEATAHSIEQVTEKQTAALVENADIIGLGFPIYGSDMLRPFHQFLERLPTIQPAKAVLGYVTQMAWSGNGINFLDAALKSKGYSPHLGSRIPHAKQHRAGRLPFLLLRRL